MASYFPKNVTSILLSTLLSACGGGGDDQAETSSTNGQSLSEEWVGLFRATNGPEVDEPGTILPDVYEGGISINMRKQGSNVTGSYSTTNGGEGSVSGTFNSEAFNLTLTQSENCPGKIGVSGTLSDDGTLVATSISGSDCQWNYQSGTARLIKSPPSPKGASFTGVYYGTNLSRTGFLLLVETQNSHDFQGEVWVLSSDLGPNTDDGIKMISSPVSGTLGNADGECASYCYTKLEMTNIVSEYSNSDEDLAWPTSGSVTILDYYSEDSRNVLHTTWSFEHEQGDTATGRVILKESTE